MYWEVYEDIFFGVGSEFESCSRGIGSGSLGEIEGETVGVVDDPAAVAVRGFDGNSVSRAFLLT